MVVSRKTRFLVLERDNSTCQYCGLTPKDGVKLEIDHKIPVSKGGGDSIENLTTSCYDCNHGKHAFLNYTKLKPKDITPEIANEIYPILYEKLWKDIDTHKYIKDKEYATECKNILDRNSKIIIQMFGLEKDDGFPSYPATKFLYELRELVDKYDELYYTKLESKKEHLEIYKEYHEIKSDTDVAIKLIKNCLIPNKFIQMEV